MVAHLPERIARICALFALLVVLPAELHAQSAPPLAPGDRIRISSPSVSVEHTGEFVRMDEETLVLKRDRTGDTIRVALAEWPQLERSLPRAHAGETSLIYGGIGIVVGGATGLLLGHAIGEESRSATSSGCVLLCTRKDAMQAFGMMLGLAGGLYAALSPHRWEPLTLPQGLSVGATAGEGLVLSMTLWR